MSTSIYPIDLSQSRTRWCAYNSDDARAYAAALVVAGISYTMFYARATPEVEQWCFDRINRED